MTVMDDPAKNKSEPLPIGWAEAKLGDFAHVVAGQSPPGDTYNETGEGLPFFQGKAEFGPLYPTVRKWCTAPSKFARLDDVLVSIRAPVGPTNLSPGEIAIGRGLAAVQPTGGVLSLFLLNGIRAKRIALEKQATGTTFAAISADVLRSLPFPLPPLAEQTRIVTKIEELFSKLDAGVAELKRTQVLLKRYRQSVLHAAVTGELSRVWREAQGSELEDAGAMLAKILDERRARWAASGKRGQYKEPQGLDVTGLPDLPIGWVWATPDQMISGERYDLAIGPFGSNLTVSDYKEEGVPLIFVRNIRSNDFRLSRKFVSAEKSSELHQHSTKSGDILITKMGAPPGDATIYPENHQDAIITSDCIKMSCHRTISSAYVVFTINSEVGRKGEFKLLAHHSDGTSVPPGGCDTPTLFGVCCSLDAERPIRSTVPQP